MAEIDPWGDVEIGNYKQKMEDFGIDSLSKDLKKELPKHRYITRNIIFGHRDLKKITKAKKQGKNFAALTGIMPSGLMHLGHKIVVDQMKMYQEMGAEIHICAADIEAYNTRNISIEKARELVKEEYLTNYIALGLDIEKADFYFQSEGGNKYHARSKQFSKHLTQNQVEATYGSAEPSKITSAITQYADILKPQFPENNGPKPTVVPIGVDQDPHMRLTRDIAAKYQEIDFQKPSATYNKFMRGLQGGKMSSSNPKSYIALTDTVKEAKNKIDQAKTGGRDTLEEHRQKGAKIEEDMVFELLAFHLIEDDQELDRIKKEYQSGEMLSGELKQIAKDKIEEFLTEHKAKRKEAQKQVEKHI